MAEYIETQDQRIDLSKVKLIIWDLDNTFWNGVISEEEITPNAQNIELIKNLSMHGVVNSICSKNDFEPCKQKLSELGVWDYFVFPSIDWTAKAQRIYAIIKDMGLRPANVLFLDDEPYNQQAAKAVDGNLMCGSIQELYGIISSQISILSLQKDMKRLKQYRELQEKVKAKREFDSDLEFLKNSDIRITLLKDCETRAERITELIARTNQLNFTKKRIEKQEVETLVSNKEYECACISVKDKYCDYGITGFYALHKQGRRLEHFLFSCRTIGMGVEQFVYAKLGYPALEVKGDVVNQLSGNNCPDWIKLNDDSKNSNPQNDVLGSLHKILFKGPCDVSQVVPFFKNTERFETEFSYVSTEKAGTYVESMNHMGQILMSVDVDEKTRKMMVKTLPFIDNEYFNTKIFTANYDYVVFSLLTDYSLGLYQNKKRPELIIPFAQYTIDYTQWDNWNEIMHQQTTNSDEQIASDYKYFVENYKFIGRETDEQIIKNLERLRELLPSKTVLILLNGSEKPYVGQCKPGYENREKLHKQLNPLVADFVARHSDNCHVIDITELLQGENPYLDTINHYKKTVYYQIARAIQDYILSMSSDAQLEVRGANSVLVDNIKKIYFQLKGWGYETLTKIRNGK